jgi:hypothetical protein
MFMVVPPLSSPYVDCWDILTLSQLLSLLFVPLR